ncbi:DUF4258 domain-containing protein [bacterium BD-1]|nr:DUF4258 domain-containing protein [Ottowia caeni]
MTLPKTLSILEAEALLDDLLELPLSVQFSDHAVQQASTRHVSHDEAMTVLRRGVLDEPPAWDHDYQSWKLKISLEADGERITVCAAIDENPPGRLYVAVVTVIAQDI